MSTAATKRTNALLPAQDYDRSETAGDMLARRPGWLLQWGVLSVLLVFGLVLAVAAFVRYPDTLEGSMIITTDPLPIVLKPQVAGRLLHLYQSNDTAIPQGAVIAELENTTGFTQIQSLEQLTDQIEHAVTECRLNDLETMPGNSLQALGDAQQPYNQLIQSVAAFVFLKRQDIYRQRISGLAAQATSMQSLNQLSSEEQQLSGEELAQADQRFAANEQLYRDKVISRQEYYDEAARLRQKKMAMEQHRKEQLQNAISLRQNNQQISDIAHEELDKETELRLKIAAQTRDLHSFIQTWKQRYLLTAPFNCRLHYLRPVQVNELVGAGQPLFEAVPADFHYRANVQLPAAGAGKLHAGQTAHLLPDKFPFNEYGYLEGKVLQISAIPEPVERDHDQKPAYRVVVDIPGRLLTSYHKLLPFTPDMTGTARIITQDRSLLQRLLAGAAAWQEGG